MKIFALIVISVLLSLGFSSAQDSLVTNDNELQILSLKKENSITLQSTYAKTGLYAGLAWNSKLYKGLQMNMSLATKVRHLSLNKFTPLVSVGIGYDLFRKKSKLDVVPGIRGQLITSRLTQNSTVNNVDILLGYEFVLGNRFHFLHGAYYGFGHEDSENINIKYPSFLIHIGFGYVFK